MIDLLQEMKKSGIIWKYKKCCNFSILCTQCDFYKNYEIDLFNSLPKE